MSKLNFALNQYLSLGAEIEIQLIDPLSGDLNPVGLHVLETLKNDPCAPRIKSEIFQSMLEIDTPICENAIQIGSSLRESLERVRQAALLHKSKVMMAGTHPTALHSERLLTPQSRYFSLVDRNQWIARKLQIFGLHVHLGMKSGEQAMAMSNAFCHYLPLILALSASSPYWHREDTGLASSRITVFESIPTGGHPYLLNTWHDFEELVERLMRSKSILSLKDLWWDIRPNTEFGTIEIRIADCPPTIKEVEVLVALIHCIALYIDSELLEGRAFASYPEWILRENKWRASRHGIEAEFVSDLQGNSKPFSLIWKDLKKSLHRFAKELNYEKHLNFVDEILKHGPSYVRQRSHSSKGFNSIIQHLIRENENDRPEWDLPR